MPDPGAPHYLGLPVGEFLEMLSAGEAAPGGGSAAALAAALGASLCVMAARLSTQQPGAAGRCAPRLAEDAARLRDQVAGLCDADAQAYRRVIEALRAPAEPDQAHRRAAITGALSAAASVPVQVAEIAAHVSHLAARLAREGNPSLRGDAITAALLAASAAQAAAVLVGINLADAPEDDRHVRVARLAREAAQCAAKAQCVP